MEDKVQFLAAVTEDLVTRGLHAGKLVGQVAKIAGGSGGGKPNMAQAGGKEPAETGGCADHSAAIWPRACFRARPDRIIACRFDV